MNFALSSRNPGVETTKATTAARTDAAANTTAFGGRRKAIAARGIKSANPPVYLVPALRPAHTPARIAHLIQGGFSSRSSRIAYRAASATNNVAKTSTVANRE